MNSSRRQLCAMFAAMLAFGVSDRAAADIVPGVDWHARKAEVAALVRAQGGRDAEDVPPGQQRVEVRVILKGFDTRQTWLLPARTLKPGQEAIVLRVYHAPHIYQPSLQLKRLTTPPQFFVWPVEGGNVMTGGVPLESEGKFIDRGPVTLQAVLDEIARAAPEEAGLHAHLVGVMLFPDQLDKIIGNNQERIAYVRFVAVLRDLDRDVSALADLLEAPDRKVRDAAIKKLRAITNAPMGEKTPAIPGINETARPSLPLAAPKAETPAALRQWSQSWRDWWERQRDNLVWDTAKSCWLARPKDGPSARHWPAVPANFKRPVDAFPADLLRSLEKQDAAAFAVAYQVWLDSGVSRDRQTKRAETIAPELKQESNWSASGAAPRARPEVLFDAKLPAEERMKLLAQIAQQWHFDRFARERRLALEQIQKEPVGSENVRRAAFWEMLDTNVTGPGYYACQRLAQSAVPADQKLQAALFLEGPEGALIDAARVALDTRHMEFTAALIGYLRTHNDRPAEWAARILAQQRVAAALPDLLDKLKDPDARVRKWSAFALCWQPSADTVPGLLAALKTEKDAAVRNEMLTALAQTGDARGLAVLMEATTGKFEKENGMEFVRGLARIRDKKALPALATMAERFTDDLQYQAEVVNAFGWVSESFKSFSPHPFWSGGGIDPERLKVGQAAIAKWRETQPK